MSRYSAFFPHLGPHTCFSSSEQYGLNGWVGVGGQGLVKGELFGWASGGKKSFRPIQNTFDILGSSVFIPYHYFQGKVSRDVC